MLSNLHKDCKRHILISCLQAAGHVAIEPIIALYIFSYGLSVGDYVFLKSVNVGVYFLLEIPLAIILNQIGEKTSAFLALCSAVAGMIFYIASSSILGFGIAEAFLAASISIFNPSNSAIAMRLLDTHKHNAESYFHMLGSCMHFCTLSTSILSGILFSLNPFIPFWIYLSFCLCAMALLKKISTGEIVGKRSLIPKISKSTIRSLSPFCLIGIITYLVMEPVTHFWQPLYIEKFGATTFLTTGAYATFTIFYIFSSMTVSRLMSSEKIKPFHILSALPLFGSALYATVPFISSPVLLTATYSLLWSAMWLTITSITVSMRKAMPMDQRLFLGKIMSLFFRLGGCLAMGSSKFLIDSGWNMNEIFHFFSIIALLVAFGYAFWKILFHKHTSIPISNNAT